MSHQLLIATHNQGKVKEFAAMMADLPIEWFGLADVGVTDDVAETAVTFAGNAILKAQAYAAMTGLLTLADDSGLEVDALNGAPGVYTARYGGAGLTPMERYYHLLQQIANVPEAERTARFRCVIVVSDAEGHILAQSEGTCEGRIAFAPHGAGGFGYDPVFYLPEYGQTMAEIPPAEKHKISHRGQALRALLPDLRRILQDAASTG